MDALPARNLRAFLQRAGQVFHGPPSHINGYHMFKCVLKEKNLMAVSIHILKGRNYSGLKWGNEDQYTSPLAPSFLPPSCSIAIDNAIVGVDEL